MWYSPGQWDLKRNLLKSFWKKKQFSSFTKMYLRRNVLFSVSPHIVWGHCIKAHRDHPVSMRKQTEKCRTDLSEEPGPLASSLGHWFNKSHVVYFQCYCSWAYKFSLFNWLLIAYSVASSQWTQGVYQRIHHIHLLNIGQRFKTVWIISLKTKVLFLEQK